MFISRFKKILLQEQQIPQQPETQQPIKLEPLDDVEQQIKKQKEMQTPLLKQTQPGTNGQTPGSIGNKLPIPQTGSPLEKMPTGSELAAQAKNILGQHKDFASYSEDRFNQHLLLGNRLVGRWSFLSSC